MLDTAHSICRDTSPWLHCEQGLWASVQVGSLCCVPDLLGKLCYRCVRMCHSPLRNLAHHETAITVNRPPSQIRFYIHAVCT